jgi:hypothetical protein
MPEPTTPKYDDALKDLRRRISANSLCGQILVGMAVRNAREIRRLQWLVGILAGILGLSQFFR